MLVRQSYTLKAGRLPSALFPPYTLQSFRLVWLSSLSEILRKKIIGRDGLECVEKGVIGINVFL